VKPLIAQKACVVEIGCERKLSLIAASVAAQSQGFDSAPGMDEPWAP
jgi:hypothetical protein